MSELVVALAIAAALGAKPAPAQSDPQHQARSRPPVTAVKAQVAQSQSGKPNAPRQDARSPAL